MKPYFSVRPFKFSVRHSNYAMVTSCTFSGYFASPTAEVSCDHYITGKGVLFSQQWVPSAINSCINRWEERDGNRTPPLMNAQLRLIRVTSSLAIPKIIEIMIFFFHFSMICKGF